MKKYLIAVFLLLIIVVSGVGGYLLYKNSFSSTMSNGKRQAVFLTNGQVYFGKVDKNSNNFLVLKDIYYLKTQDVLNGDSATDQADDKKKISIIKLGEELHGPEDEMIINKDNVLFVENMRDNSKINEAIKSYKDKQKTGQN